MRNAAQTYVQTQFTTTGQAGVLLLLYDGALKFLAQARERILARDVAGKGIAISKALDVIAELDGSLRPDVGGSLAENLHQLYFICSTRLLMANLKMDVAMIDNVSGVLSGLRSAYAEIMNRPEALAASRDIEEKQKAFSIKGKADAVPGAVFPADGHSDTRMPSYAAARQKNEAAGAQAPAFAPESPASAGTGVSVATSMAAYGRAARYSQS
jgi:flagellar protein FliS